MYLKLLSILTNYLRKWGMDKLAKYLSNRLYNSLNVSKMIGEVYQDCLDSMKQNDSDVDKKWSWMQTEHLFYLQGERTYKDLKPETQKLCNVFSEKIVKKHPIAMAVMESFKADLRYDKHTKLLNDILDTLKVPQGDADVVFENGETLSVIHPTYKRIRYMKKINTRSDEKKQEFLSIVEQANALPRAVANMVKLREMIPAPAKIQLRKGRRNKSFVPLSFCVNNSGDVLVPNCDVIITCPQDSIFSKKNEENFYFSEAFYGIPNAGIFLIDDHTLQLNVGDLKQNRQFVSSDVFIKVPSESKEITLNWNLSSNTIIKDGELKLVNEPSFEEIIEETEGNNADSVVGEDFVEDIM